MTKEVAFAELYQAHYRQVRGLCRQLLRSPERAEDAAQEAFLRAYRALGDYDRAQPFGGWIMSIARNHCLDLLRRRGVAALTAERAQAVNAAVAKLPERYRIPLALAYYADAGYDEIAAELRITRTHVGVLLCRAKQLLRKTLAEETQP
jgi:RNA polymerase sigma-70 factor (ECF subfamily)